LERRDLIRDIGVSILSEIASQAEPSTAMLRMVLQSEHGMMEHLM